MVKFNPRRRLYRSRQQRSLAGVCGGIAEYLDVDPSLVRIAWVLLSMAGGPALLLYIVMAVVVPEEPEFIPASAEKPKRSEVEAV
ncbi:MAG: PspC domain-containing protein [Chloroflexi bacterium]|nr:PspC domain-containing protein [Chloroflexota bacterium]MCY3582059.1 PspC domain-containing protein [Chloroflexota bacterium]MCY3715324.1 PspC domain-containing protein [Chloroflexota bacterium]MDE2649533.1 PspC domain-containing protein [Chloroflexota bacterium]MXV92941.1 PspC domain-containing protein [Chloroflexota bacterium]